MATDATVDRSSPVMFSEIPFRDPGTPDTRSPTRFLIWIGANQKAALFAGAGFWVVWMCAQAAFPAAIGRAVSAMTDLDRGGVIGWSLVIMGLGILQATAGVLRHRRAVTSFTAAVTRVLQLIARQTVRLGADLTPMRAPAPVRRPAAGREPTGRPVRPARQDRSPIR